MDERLIADYLLFVLNQHKQFEYVELSIPISFVL